MQEDRGLVYREQDFPQGQWLTRDGVLTVVGPTWYWNPRKPFEKFDAAFRRNLRRARRAALDYGCIAPQNDDESYCKIPDAIRQFANPSRNDPILPDGSLDQKLKPRHGMAYFMHFDLSKSRDHTGIALGHWDSRSDKCVIDLMLDIAPPPGGEIQIDAMRQWCYTLKKRGFWLKSISFDGWQSAEGIQELNRRGFNAILYSVDRNTAAYDTALELLLDGRLDYYYHPVLDDNWRSLVLVGGRRVDHKADGAKDLSDAVAAVAFHCVTEGKASAGIGVF